MNISDVVNIHGSSDEPLRPMTQELTSELTHLKYEKNPKIKEAITQKIMEYLLRAEEIRAVLDEDGLGPACNGDAAVATRPKTKPKDGNDGEDADKEKLRSGLNSAIIRE
ncbi:unnamed protein product [Fraxinus pennsylvanica]|uniref:Uncharacterized protein n=1 Tax=Fraxinus pennsylvanica TaxID=56036 RepID=A0AAD2EBS4_9LAMI|nr:unnamed protein product [Fraxinus pennsylvanica]